MKAVLVVDHIFLLGSTKMKAFGFAEAVSAEMLTVRGNTY